MSKRRLTWTQERFEQFVKDGRGQGRGQDYKPWLTIHDFPSEGRSTRSPGWKTNRIHHFLSDQEMRYFYLVEWSDMVIDVREQYPLLDIDLAIQIAEDMVIRYPTDSVSGVPYVLTTDFMLTLEENGRSVEVAHTIKHSKKLDEKRVVEKLELERRYWATKEVEWGIVTEKEIPLVLARNIEWLHSAYRMESTKDVSLPEMLFISSILKKRLLMSVTPISKVTTELDKEMNLEIGTSLYIFKHLVARKEIVLDMQSKINVCHSAKTIQKIMLSDNNMGALA